MQRQIRDIAALAHERAEVIRGKFREIVPEYRSPGAPVIEPTPVPIDLAARRVANE